jgi:FkbM family methyltransferase
MVEGNAVEWKITARVTGRFRLFIYGLRRRLGARKITIRTNWGSMLEVFFTDVSAFPMYFGNYEEQETQKIVKNVTRGMTAFDIGAHMGYFTLLMAELVGPNGCVFAFEPNPIMYSRLRSNIALNPQLEDGRVKTFPVALGKEKGLSSFFCPILGHEGVGGLKDVQRAPVSKRIHVDVDTLDSIIIKHNIKRLDFLKIDVEGGEYDIFKGSEYVLRELRPTILFEACELNTDPYGYRVFEELHYLEQRGYKVKQAGFSYNFVAVPTSKNENSS